MYVYPKVSIPTQELGQDSFSVALPHSSETLPFVDQAFFTPIIPISPLGMTQFASDENPFPLRNAYIWSPR